MDIKILRNLSALLAAVFGLLLLPKLFMQILILSHNFTESVLFKENSFFVHMWPNALIYLTDKVPTLTWSLFHLALPSFFFFLSSLLLRKQKDDLIVSIFECILIFLLSVLAYYLVRLGFHINENLLFSSSSLFERGILTNLYFLMTFVCLWIGRVYCREAVTLGGIVLLVFTVLRIIYFDMLGLNPLWSRQDVGDYPLLNYLILPYGLPILWLIILNKELIKSDRHDLTRSIDIFAGVLLFFFITLNVRQFFHHPFMDHVVATNAEIYSYSIAWLITGIALLFAGTLYKNKAIRIASLAFMVLTIGKVFLYDASELTGLYRVFSFLGLGLSLLALSWFYTRFIFKRL